MFVRFFFPLLSYDAKNLEVSHDILKTAEFSTFKNDQKKQ